MRRRLWAAAAALLVAAGATASEVDEAGDAGEDFEVNLWPVAESTTLASGARRTSTLLVYHKTAYPSGETYSWHAGPLFRGPDYWLILPLAYGRGAPGARHSGLVPFHFRGPGYRVTPPLLSGRWKHADGAESTWITPLFHRTQDPDGTTRHAHALTYFQGPDWKVLFPVAYQFGDDVGVPPVYFGGPGYRVSPPLASGWWRHADGAESTWITPLFHRTKEPDGTLRHAHALTYFQGPDWKVLLPVAYSVGEKGSRHSGLVPVYFRGPGYEVCAPALAAWWRHADGSESSWWTPFVHKTIGVDGDLRHLHVFNYFQGRGWKVLFPLAYQAGEHAGVAPFYFRGPGYRLSPAFASGWWRHADGAESTWITPLFHRTMGPDGTVRHAHALTYFRGPGWKVLFPLAYQFGERVGVGPFYLAGAGFKTSPPLLSAWWRHADGAESTWITPLFHRTRERDGAVRHSHALNYLQGADWRTLVPLWWQWKGAEGETRSLVPFLYWGTTGPRGEVRRSVLPPLFTYRRGEELDTSVGFQLRPFSYQRAGADRELNVLWRMFHYRREGRATRVMVGPLWKSERPKPGRPASFQVLGGLLARDCNHDRGSYRYRLLWLFPVGPRRRFVP